MSICRSSMLCLAAWCSYSALAMAQTTDPAASSGGITVSGTGEVTTKPDLIEVNLRVTASAELTKDAITKHRDARQRTLKAFEGLIQEGLKIDERDLAVKSVGSREQMQMVMNGMPAQGNTRSQTEVSCVMRARMPGVAALSDEDILKLVAKLLDTAQDAGTKVGPSDEEMMMAYRYGRQQSNVIVRFVFTDAERVREEAYRKAADDARARAERLAKLEGVKLGRVMSVQETFISDETAGRGPTNPYTGTEEPGKMSRGEVTSDAMSVGTFRVKLTVRFAIEPDNSVATN